jgi:hypothetical protein
MMVCCDEPVYIGASVSNAARRARMPHSAFDTLPIIDLSLANNPETKHRVLEELRYAVFNVGFMYIKNTGIPDVPFLAMLRTDRRM